MKKIGKKPTDDQLLEGGGSGSGIGGTKWSSMPSFRGSSSTLNDLKKLTAPPTKAKGAAKRAVEMAEDRAVSRMVARGAGASALAAGAKAMSGKEAAAKVDDDYEDMGGNAVPDSSNPTGVAGTGMKKGGSVSSASKRADGIAQRGKTKGRML
jgi:hypothetical protein